MNDLKKKFRTSLLKWNREKNRREMPWKGIKDPYKVWLSEIILQQTRVEQGLSYYLKFVSKYPDIGRLAAAPENEVFKMWEGLGYYSRCRNLIATARKIVSERKGVFPDSYAEILELPGIGPYTAAAISSFVYNLPHAVIDGNVIRVLSRYFMIPLAFDKTEGKKFFTALASDCLSRSHPGAYNQAIMDFGATVCKPVPDCLSCPLNAGCLAYSKGQQLSFPRKSRKIEKRIRWFTYFLVESNGRFFYRKRSGRDIWQNLHELILLESEKETGISKAAEKVFGKGNFLIREKSGLYSQILTHQQIHARFVHIELARNGRIPSGYAAGSKQSLRKKAFPRLITRYLAETEFFRRTDVI